MSRSSVSPKEKEEETGESQSQINTQVIVRTSEVISLPNKTLHKAYV